MIIKFNLLQEEIDRKQIHLKNLEANIQDLIVNELKIDKSYIVKQKEKVLKQKEKEM